MIMKTEKICVCRHFMVALAALLSCGATAKPQDMSLSYVSEWQATFDGKYQWVNLLQADASVPLYRGIGAEAGVISTCKTSQDALLPNLLTYSNIEEENIPLALTRLGISYGGEKFRIFAGVGNVNGEFFATPLAALFTNSSCGIFPTISANFSIANYPDASLGVEGRYESRGFTANCAVYNGCGSHRFTGREGVFRFCPGSDGIFNINAVNYRKNDNNYNLGIGLHHGRHGSNEDAASESVSASALQKQTSVFWWAYAEQKIWRGLSVMAQYSQCRGIGEGCRDFGGAGLVYDHDRYSIGLYSCYAGFTDEHEWAGELTFRYDVLSWLSLQPALHYIRNTTANGAVGLFRVNLTL